ncbi:MAG: L-seryl-tRNA(Sec) selenium transferase [Anaerolineales bacterium]|jgi:L-seryl-tRNA(Ser) seleniumtransferase|nr:L-seryl-tRNA(Sec) selenium transferase [Anaerolineales bacterium]HJO33334.1 L-seryl-tRNA(Sec) selenium transferase [Anaerolineales bacterium]
MANEVLRALPAVDALLNNSAVAALLSAFGRPLTTAAIRNVLTEARAELQRDTLDSPPPSTDELIERATGWLRDQSAPTLHALINATGVILHTNLGRAPLSDEAQQAMLAVASDYNTLEFDLASGKRSKRSLHAEALLCQVTGAEAALVVNNNAAAVLLVLRALARRKGVVISRGQLVEIGGGFRVPDVLKQSGAKLVEVGTTNRTHLHDYEKAIATQENRVALILRAHHSNFRIVGFTTEPDLPELVALGRKHGLPVADDLGSGTLLETTTFGLGHEPTVQESLHAGADVVCFSGDKLLGGPQAGIVIGREGVVTKLKRHPLARAIRADKLCLAALSSTLLHYLKDEAVQKIPVWRMISMGVNEVEARAQRMVKAVGGELLAGKSTVGGGSLPAETLPTRLVGMRVRSPQRLAQRLRQHRIVARIQDDRVLFDLRTVPPTADSRLVSTLQQLLA